MDQFKKFKRENENIFTFYLWGMIGAFFIIPSYALCSWVIDINLFELDLQSLRNFMAVTLPGWCWYFIGGALAIRIYRKHSDDKKGGVSSIPPSTPEQDEK